MRILLTGATGYIGKRLIPLLIDAGHEVVCCVRDRSRFPKDGIYGSPLISLLEVDFLGVIPSKEALGHIDAAYYLIHSMSSGSSDFDAMEEQAARNFTGFILGSGARQVIYLGGIANSDQLSQHLASRQKVEGVLNEGSVPLTALRAGIIVGSGSASFEIVRDLVEKLPVMVTPKWLNTKSQPIAVRNILEYLSGVLLREDTFGRGYDVGGPDVLTYKEMLLQFASVRGLNRFILTVPVMTPRLSSYWLYFVTATSYKLAVHLVNSMKVEVVASPNDLAARLGIQLLTYREAVELAFQRIEQNNVVSSWKDAFSSSSADRSLSAFIDVPELGCFVDHRARAMQGQRTRVLDNLWAIGGERGWYYGNWLWQLRGFIDKLFGGVGLRRGRRSPTELQPGEAVDFWRVLVADKDQGRLLLYAEMKLPGEAWLEFRITGPQGREMLTQTATFRPRGVLGRLYWYAVLPFHFFVFEGMLRNVIAFKNT
jgi:uncharacterized protein YbjT (DUF2867 family)